MKGIVLQTKMGAVFVDMKDDWEDTEENRKALIERIECILSEGE